MENPVMAILKQRKRRGRVGRIGGSARRLITEPLEPRAMLAANLQAGSIFVSDSTGAPITDFVVGEQVNFTATWTSTDVAANTNANVRIWLDGQILGTFPRLISAGANQSYQQTTTAWYARPGEHTLEFRVDTGNVIAEADETDNVATFMFTALDPNLATKFVDPIGGVILQDWAVSAYVDVDLRSGSYADASGGSVAYDGHTGNDLFLSQLFSAMDRGLGIFAVADGTVIAVQDGYFDREVTLTSMNWNAVILDHGNGFLAAYGHMATNTVAVKEGDHVTAGQLLGLVGSSGYTNGAHLHFEIHHNNRVVETRLAPDVYWAAPDPYMGDLPTTTLVSGITNYTVALGGGQTPSDIDEGPSRVSVFPTSVPWNVTYSAYAYLYNSGDPIQVRWYRPDGSLERADNYQPPSNATGVLNQWNLEHARWSQFPGSWQVALVVDGAEIDRQSFEVTTGPGVPEIRLTQGATYVIDGRTTPIDFGMASGAPQALIFRIQNHGSVELITSELELPPGFSPVGAFPPRVAPGSTADFTVQLDAAVPGDKFGQLRFQTNDADEGKFEFNIKGTVSGSAPVESPQIVLMGPAVPYIKSSAPQRIAANATVADVDSAHFGSGSLTVELAFGATTDDRLGIANQGTADGQIGTVCGMVTYGGVPIGSVTGGMGATPLVINFNGAATVPAVQALLRNLTFANVSPQPATHHRYLRLTLVDETGNASNMPIAHVVVDPRPGPMPAASVHSRLGAVSGAPAAGPVVINEVMYHPAAGDTEFIELFNTTDADVLLGDGSNGWALSGAVYYGFPAGATVPAGNYLLVSPIAPDVVRAACDVPADVSIVGPYEGELPDDGVLELTMPGSGTDRIVVERLAYGDQPPWPTEADGDGASLSRYSPLGDAGDAANWRPGVFDGTPGRANRFLDPTPPTAPGMPMATVQSGPHVMLSWAPSVDPDSGVAQYHVLRNGVEVAATTATSFVDTQAELNTSYSYRIVAENSTNIRSAASGATPLRIFTMNNLVPIDATHLRATFSEPVTAESAQNVANYALRNSALVSATLEAGGMSVLLETAAPMLAGTGYRVVANGLVGMSTAAGSVIQHNAQRTAIAGVVNGLLGEYYDDPATSFTTPPDSALVGPKVGERVDAVINFSWLSSPLPAFNPPLPATAANTFGVRWIGRLFAPVSGDYTFSFLNQAADGIRLWIDANEDGLFEDIVGERLVNAWPTNTTSVTASPITLVGQKLYNIRIDAYDDQSAFRAAFQWQHPNQPTPATVPSANLVTPTLIETDRPNVTRATFGSTAWASEFLAALAAAGFGSSGIDVPLDGSTSILPWSNLNQVSLTFDEDVNVGQGDLLVNGVNAASYGIAGFDYDYATYTATWTLANPLPNDRITFSLAGSVLDLVGNSVEGATTATLLALPGDVNQSGAVDHADFRENLDRQFSGVGTAGYSVLHDTDGNGAINIQDWHNVLLAIGDTLPPTPSPPFTVSAVVVSSHHSSPLAADRPARLRATAPARLSHSAIDQIVATQVDSAGPKLRASRVPRPLNSVKPAALDLLFTIP
jgi:hypothetical protein